MDKTQSRTAYRREVVGTTNFMDIRRMTMDMLSDVHAIVSGKTAFRKTMPQVAWHQNRRYGQDIQKE